MKFLTPALMLLLGSVSGMKLTTTTREEHCGLEVSGPIKSSKHGEVIENLYVYASPTDDTAMFIRHKNVTVRNVVVHHAANSRGIYFFRAPGLTVENVEVVAYGVHATTDEQNWGANPCPLRSPFGGYNCANILGRKSDDVSFENVRVEGGSKGISLSQSKRGRLSHVTAKNVRGPNPGGQCFQMAMSDDAVIDGFHCLNEMGKSWVGDSISLWRSSNVELKNGVVDGNNAPFGICVMFEGSKKSVHGGLVENVEARHCQGCFSGYPSNGLVMRHNTCADSWCDGTPERGPKSGKFNLWQFGNNNVHKVYAQNNIVEDSYYQDSCPNTRIAWSAAAKTKNPVVTWGDFTDLGDSYVPKKALTHEFAWNGCMEVPDISCEDFPMQAINNKVKKTNVNTGEDFYVISEGQCQPNPGNPKHPKEK